MSRCIWQSPHHTRLSSVQNLSSGWAHQLYSLMDTDSITSNHYYNFPQPYTPFVIKTIFQTIARHFSRLANLFCHMKSWSINVIWKSTSAFCYERQAVIELEEHGSSSPANTAANGLKSEQSHAKFSIKSENSSLTLSDYLQISKRYFMFIRCASRMGWLDWYLQKLIVTCFFKANDYYLLAAWQLLCIISFKRETK